jgi:hypothetical protein
MRLRNFMLAGVGATAALVIGLAASAQDPLPPSDDPHSQLDRTFGDEPEGVGGGNDQGTATDEGTTNEGLLEDTEGTGGAGDAGMGRSSGMKMDGGMMMDGGMKRDGGMRMGRDGGTGGSGDEGSATEDDHSDIILYGPNGIPEDESSPQTPEGAGGSGDEGDARIPQ